MRGAACGPSLGPTPSIHAARRRSAMLAAAMRRFVVFALVLSACGRCGGPAPAPRPTAATTAVVSTPAPVPAVPTAQDLVLTEAPTADGPLDATTIEADARMALGPLRECARAMPVDATFAIRFGLVDTGSVLDATLEGDLPVPAAECVHRVARTLRFRLTTAASGASVRIAVRAITRPDGVAIDPSLACDGSDECVFVTGSCQKPFTVHRAHAAHLDRLRTQVMQGAECSSTPTIGFEAVCFRGMCTDREVALDDVRCSSDAQCATLVYPDGSHRAVARARSRDVAERGGAHVAAANEEAPAATCHYGGCLLRWAGE